MSSQRELEIHALVLVFVPEDDWEEMGEDAIYSRVDPFYPHGEGWGPTWRTNAPSLPTPG